MVGMVSLTDRSPIIVCNLLPENLRGTELIHEELLRRRVRRVVLHARKDCEPLIVELSESAIAAKGDLGQVNDRVIHIGIVIRLKVIIDQQELLPTAHPSSDLVLLLIISKQDAGNLAAGEVGEGCTKLRVESLEPPPKLAQLVVSNVLTFNPPNPPEGLVRPPVGARDSAANGSPPLPKTRNVRERWQLHGVGFGRVTTAPPPPSASAAAVSARSTIWWIAASVVR